MAKAKAVVLKTQKENLKTKLQLIEKEKSDFLSEHAKKIESLKKEFAEVDTYCVGRMEKIFPGIMENIDFDFFDSNPEKAKEVYDLILSYQKEV